MASLSQCGAKEDVRRKALGASEALHSVREREFASSGVLEMSMIFGYILGTKEGLLIADRFFGAPPGAKSELAVSALSAIRSFTLSVLSESIEQVVTGRNQISLAVGRRLMLAAISRVNVAVAKQLAKKYVKIIEEKIGETEINGSTPELFDMIKEELNALEGEINEVNGKYSQISYI
ncbi:MAG: hypothetical protein WED04_09750 [Promethearchaeati archaeon SRVP18_Atabeyarchaeia-1]